jgi:hypothetical protein
LNQETQRFRVIGHQPNCFHERLAGKLPFFSVEVGFSFFQLAPAAELIQSREQRRKKVHSSEDKKQQCKQLARDLANLKPMGAFQSCRRF